MAIDSKGNNHQPKGTPNAGKSAPKAGAGDDNDLWYKPRYLVGAGGTAWGGRYVPKAGAGDGDMAAFHRPWRMGRRAPPPSARPIRPTMVSSAIST